MSQVFPLPLSWPNSGTDLQHCMQQDIWMAFLLFVSLLLFLKNSILASEQELWDIQIAITANVMHNCCIFHPLTLYVPTEVHCCGCRKWACYCVEIWDSPKDLYQTSTFSIPNKTIYMIWTGVNIAQSGQIDVTYVQADMKPSFSLLGFSLLKWSVYIFIINDIYHILPTKACCKMTSNKSWPPQGTHNASKRVRNKRYSS